MSLGINRTNYYMLELNFKDIVLEVRKGADKPIPIHHGDKIKVNSFVIVFKFEIPNLKCIEFINENGEIVEYWYDWEYLDGSALMKFHGHFHPPNVPEEIKKFDPFHLHKRISPLDTKAILREKDIKYQNITNVMLFIKDYIYVMNNNK